MICLTGGADGPLAPLLQPALETVFDFLPADTLIVVDDPDAGEQRLLRYAEELLENFDLAVESGRVVSPPAELAVGADGGIQQLGNPNIAMHDFLEKLFSPCGGGGPGPRRHRFGIYC